MKLSNLAKGFVVGIGLVAADVVVITALGVQSNVVAFFIGIPIGLVAFVAFEAWADWTP